MQDQEREKAERQNRIIEIRKEIFSIERGNRGPDADTIDMGNALLGMLRNGVESKAANFANELNHQHFGGRALNLDLGSEGAIAYFFSRITFLLSFLTWRPGS